MLCTLFTGYLRLLPVRASSALYCELFLEKSLDAVLLSLLSSSVILRYKNARSNRFSFFFPFRYKRVIETYWYKDVYTR